MILDLIFEHIPILKQLLNFSSCRVLRQLPEFLSMYIFKHLRTYVTKQDFLIRWNRNKIENKNKLFFYNLKSLQHLEIKILISFLTIYRVSQKKSVIYGAWWKNCTFFCVTVLFGVFLIFFENLYFFWYSKGLKKIRELFFFQIQKFRKTKISK